MKFLIRWWKSSLFLPASPWEVWFSSTLGVPIPVLIGSSQRYTCNVFDYDVCRDHLQTCQVKSVVSQVHEWVVYRLGSILGSVGHKVKIHSILGSVDHKVKIRASSVAQSRRHVLHRATPSLPRWLLPQPHRVCTPHTQPQPLTTRKHTHTHTLPLTENPEEEWTNTRMDESTQCTCEREISPFSIRVFDVEKKSSAKVAHEVVVEKRCAATSDVEVSCQSFVHSWNVCRMSRENHQHW
jgi:hypothetical protein